MYATSCDFVPNPGQQAFLNAPQKFRLAITGVGGGKSAVGAVDTLCVINDNPGVPGMIISPTYDMLRLNTVPPIQEWWPQGLIKNPKAMNTKNGPFQVTTWNNTPIYFRSGNDPDQLRGPNLGWVWLDEAGQMDRYVWDVLIGRLRRPCPRPSGIFTTTPAGYNWLYDLFVDDKPSDEYEMYWWPARENEHNLLPGFYDEMFAALPPLLAKQEIEGKFVNVNAQAFLSVASVMQSERPQLPRMPQDDQFPLFVGVDIGRKHDLTVIWGLYLQGDTLYTACLNRMHNAPFERQQEAIESILPHCTQVCIDRTGIGANLVETLEYEHGPVIQGIDFGPKSKSEMAARMRKLFEKGLLRIPKEARLRRSLMSVETQYTQTGQVSLYASRNEDGHADEFWALALACHAFGTQPSDILLAFV